MASIHWDPYAEGSRTWSPSIRNKIENYISMNFTMEHQISSKKTYVQSNVRTARILLEYHNNSTNPLKFTEEELKEIQTVAGVMVK